MSVHDVIKPTLRPSGKLNGDGNTIIDFSFFSGPKKKKNQVVVELTEYDGILNRIIQDDVLINSIIKTWREYAAALRKYGKSAEPPLGDYHKRLAELCDPLVSDRAATLATVFGEKIESDALYKYIKENNPPWASEILIQRAGD